MEETKMWHNVIEELIQCPVCLDIPSCPIFQCTTGHAICQSCMKSLQQTQRTCPMCKQNFTSVRNFAVENLIQNLNLIQLAFKEDIYKIENKYKKESTDICTQTNGTNANTSTTSSQTSRSLRMKTSSTQTQQRTVQKNPSNKTKITSNCTNILQKSQNNEMTTFYSCLIGSCLFQNRTFKQLVHHMNVCHEKQFFVENEYNDIFSKTFILDGNTLPCNYDYVFLIDKVGLLFFNSVYHSNGRVRIGVQLIQTAEIPEMYKYEINLTNNMLCLVRHGMVTPMTEKTRAVIYSIIIHEKDMIRLLKANKHLKCTLIVYKYLSNNNNDNNC